MSRRMHDASVAVLLALLAGCGGSSGGGGAMLGSTAAGSTATRAVVDLVTPSGPATGDVALAFRLLDPASAPGDVTTSFSLDGGATWRPATGAAATALATGPAPGADHALVWSSAADLSTFEPAVLVRVELSGGAPAISAPFAVDDQPVSTHVLFNRRPFLQSTTTSETLILWRTETPTDTVVEYGLTPALGQVAGDPAASTQEHQVQLTGLVAGQPAYYRVVSGGLPLTPRIRFQTAPPPTTDKLSFLVVGDSGMGNPEQHELARLMAGEQAELYLNTGDVVYPAGGVGAVVAEYNARFFQPYQDMLQRMPAYPVLGNHDLYGLLGQPFRDTFVLPDNGQPSLLQELFYTFTWGDCRFIALETNFLYKAPFGPHITWLKDVLANNQCKWVIVYMHTPLYSCGDHGDDRYLQFSLGSILERGGVDLVLTGHDHDYERTLPIKEHNLDPAYPGLVHVVTGGGGAALRPVNPNARTAVAVSTHHYLKVRIDGDWLYATAIDRAGLVVDSFALQNH